MGLEQIESFMAAIRQVESSNRYDIVGPTTRYGRVSGAYQFLPSTWGNYGGYAEAYLAPPSVQDQRARDLMTNYYREFNDWGAVAVAWHAGPGRVDDYFAGTLNVSDQLGSNTAEDYVPAVLSAMGLPNGAAGDTGDGGPPVATKEKIPSGGTLMLTGYAPVVRFEVFPGIYVDFVVDANVDIEGSGYSLDGAPRWSEPPEGETVIPAMEGGLASELSSLVDDGYTNISDWMNDTIGVLFSPNNPAWDDPQVQAIFAEWLANPDTSPDIIMGRIRNETDYWQSVNERQSTWFASSEAEQERLAAEQAAAVQDSWFQLIGVRPSMSDPKIQEYAVAIASGQMTIGQVNEELRQAAREDPESPLSRAERSEQEAQLQRGIDIENSVGELRALATNWGVEITDADLTSWATDIASNARSSEAFGEFLKDQAAVLYPWKDREIATITAAQPWLTAKQQILETGALTLFDPDIQQALTGQEGIADFRKRLKKDPRWQDTKNYADTATRALGGVNETLGFA